MFYVLASTISCRGRGLLSWFVCVTLSQGMFLLVPKGTLPHSRDRVGFCAGYLRVLVGVKKYVDLWLFIWLLRPRCLGPLRFRYAPMSMDCLMIGMGVYPSSPLGLRMYVGEDDGRAKYAPADV